MVAEKKDVRGKLHGEGQGEGREEEIPFKKRKKRSIKRDNSFVPEISFEKYKRAGKGEKREKNGMKLPASGKY